MGLSGVPHATRSAAEALEVLRAADIGGLGDWVVGAQEKDRLLLSSAECMQLASSLGEFELAPAEFERLIALTGLSLGLDFRRKLTVGKTIYGRDREVDVLFRHAQSGNRLAVEAKYQRVKGTADEKLPYAVLNQETLPLPSVIVYGGGGFHQGALHWLCASARATDVAGLTDWLAVFFAL